MKIHHTAIWVSNLEREKDFFLKYFDCTAGEKYVNQLNKFSSYFVTFKGGGRIEIMKRDDITCEEMEESLGYSHIALDAGSREEVNNLTDKLVNDGVIVLNGPRITGDGYYESVILDPENNRIEIMSE